jgi:dolichol-phosphate mannosyltransferase
MKILICVPTYNEAGNIAGIVKAIFALDLELDILVIDDSSPDGTGAIVTELMEQHDRLFLLERKGKGGLASAYIAGFRYSIEHDYDVVGEMDADFSHPPEALREVNRLFATGEYDFLIGSRYAEGGGTVNWGLIRKLISRFGSLYARTILGVPIKDMTGGFNFWTRQALDAIGIDRIVSEGYCFQIELKARACKGGMRFTEFPIIFEDRRVGESKMSKRIVLEAFHKVLLLRFTI